jgi:hypothetical protein
MFNQQSANERSILDRLAENVKSKSATFTREQLMLDAANPESYGEDLLEKEKLRNVTEEPIETAPEESISEEPIEATDETELQADDPSDDLDVDGVDEKSSAKQKAAAKKYRNSAKGRKAAKLGRLKRSKSSYKPDKARSRAAAKGARRRSDVDTTEWDGSIIDSYREAAALRRPYYGDALEILEYYWDEDMAWDASDIEEIKESVAIAIARMAIEETPAVVFEEIRLVAGPVSRIISALEANELPSDEDRTIFEAGLTSLIPLSESIEEEDESDTDSE